MYVQAYIAYPHLKNNTHKKATELIVGVTLIITEIHLALFTQVHRNGILIQSGLEVD